MRFFIICFTFFCGLNLHLQAQIKQNTTPKLVVGIVIDGLQQRHLELITNNLAGGGFKRMIERGAVCEQIHYNIVSAGNASDIASLMTGSTPFYHGVAGDNVFNRKTKRVESIITDENEAGIGTKERFSAHNLLASTVADELRLAHPATSRVYAIATNPETAIMLGGHTANAVAWLDNMALRWVSTAYYNEGLSTQADALNVNQNFDYYMSEKWTPLYPLVSYHYKPLKQNTKESFEYSPKAKINDKSNESILRNTPVANHLLTELAIKMIDREKLGKNATPDMLLLQYTVRPPGEITTALNSMEKEDMYYRLDRDLQDLFEQIEQTAGIANTVIFVTANQTSAHTPKELGENKIPAGYFNAKRSMALLNIYLMALYGQEAWIDGYYGKNIFLNRAKIEEEKLSLREVQQTVADFMIEFEGVQAGFTAGQVIGMGGNANSEMIRIRNSFHRTLAGDVVISLLPGWIEVDDTGKPVGESNAAVSTVPLLIYGWKIAPKSFTETYHITDIAPTLAKTLNIPYPNASIGQAIELGIKN